MAGRAREPGPTSMRVAENIRRIRQERGLSYAELARRLTGLGHSILDTGLLKIEKGERRVDVDDLTALAIALETTPNRLLLPAMDVELATETYRVTSEIPSTPPLMWSWATGEVPLGHRAVRGADDRQERGEEVAFTRENLPQHWAVQQWARPADAPLGIGHIIAVSGITTFIGEAVHHLFSTAEIRGIVEGAIASAIVSPPAKSAVTVTEDGLITFPLSGRVITEEDT